MDEIEVVINITKHEWEYLNKLVENGDQLGHYERLLVNGTPLPKGHGNLVDINELIENGVATESYLNTFIKTIIKADKEEV